MSLRRKLAEFGFESNDDYDFPLRCLFEAEHDHLRVLHVDGQAGRRKTAFANALGHALEYPHLLYHDFSQPEVAAPNVTLTLQDGSSEQMDAPLPPFERILTEACAYSEGEPTLLILDQLQAAAFADQIRVYHFAQTGEWRGPQGTALANRRNLVLAVISEQPIYHSLAKLSFRVWTDAERAFLDYRPEDYALGPDAGALFAALIAVFEGLGANPTPSEFGRLLQDMLGRIGSEEQLRQSIFGRIEQIDRARLYAPDITPRLRASVDALAALLGEEHIEL
jgi:hypothetical protein